MYICYTVCVQVNDHVSKYAKYIYEPVESTDGSWQLAHEDGEMKVCTICCPYYIILYLSLSVKVYRRELEEDGVVVDPLKAQHVVKVSILPPYSLLSMG